MRENRMAAKAKTIYACTECGAESTKWYGRCPTCGAWNSMEEQIQSSSTTATTSTEEFFINKGVIYIHV